jgi:hypothetical protein
MTDKDSKKKKVNNIEVDGQDPQEEPIERAGQSYHELKQKYVTDSTEIKQEGVYKMTVDSVYTNKPDNECILNLVDSNIDYNGDYTTEYSDEVAKTQLTVKYPEDTTDSSEELVRIYEYTNSSLKNPNEIAGKDILIYHDGDDTVEACLPPQTIFGKLMKYNRIFDYEVNRYDSEVLAKVRTPILFLLSGVLALSAYMTPGSLIVQEPALSLQTVGLLVLSFINIFLIVSSSSLAFVSLKRIMSSDS